MNINKFNVNAVSMCLTLKKINEDIYMEKYKSSHELCY